MLSDLFGAHYDVVRQQQADIPIGFWPKGASRRPCVHTHIHTHPHALNPRAFPSFPLPPSALTALLRAQIRPSSPSASSRG